jgi:V8-like Glu-specific endopeptidase
MFNYIFQGNSGSPVLYNRQLIGIHKGTSPRYPRMYHPEKVNLFISIRYYRDFILDVMRNF